MKTYQQYMAEAVETDIIGLMKTFGAGDIDMQPDYLSARYRKKQQVFDLLKYLPGDIDYDVFVYSTDQDTAARELENPGGIDNDGVKYTDEEDYSEEGNTYTIDEIGYEDLDDQYHDYQVVVYLYNTETNSKPEGVEKWTESVDTEDTDQLTEKRERVVKVDAKGAKKIRIRCGRGYKSVDGKCVKITGQERTNQRRGIIKRGRTIKAKGQGYKTRVQRLRKRALKKRSAFGL